MPKENESYDYVSVILLDSVFVNSDNKYYPQISFKKCKYSAKKKTIMDTINDDLKLDESYDNDESDEQTSINM